MPHSHSAKKRGRQYLKRRAHNRAVKKAIKSQIKKLSDLVQSGPADQVQSEYLVAVKKLDKAAVRRILHPNTAARKKSQLAEMVRGKAAAV